MICYNVSNNNWWDLMALALPSTWFVTMSATWTAEILSLWVYVLSVDNLMVNQFYNQLSILKSIKFENIVSLLQAGINNNSPVYWSKRFVFISQITVWLETVIFCKYSFKTNTCEWLEAIYSYSQHCNVQVIYSFFWSLLELTPW